MTVAGGGRPSAYKLADGTRVPGTTTITGRFKESGGLVHWAWSLGIEGKDYRQARDSAADAGHVAHELIDASIHNREPDLGEVSDGAIKLGQGGFQSFQAWQRQVKLTILATETPLISERYRFGGTFDALGLAAVQSEEPELLLLDWKSGNRIYGEMIPQCAAYRQLIRERCPQWRAVKGCCLLRLGKEEGNFSYNYFPERVLDQGWRAFELMRELFDIDAKLKKVVG